MIPLNPPFPYFGGKRQVAELVWQRFGNVRNYVEPFFGSGAVLLRRPHPPGIETINDLNPYLANFWRATTAAPGEVATWADWPVNESDLHARHQWLVDQVEFRERIATDPNYYDAQIAGWWVWGISQWIGGEFCSDKWWGAENVNRQKPSVRADGGSSIHSKTSPWKRRPSLSGNSGRGAHSFTMDLEAWFGALRARMRRTRVCCGSFERVLGRSVVCTDGGWAGVFLDPPYSRKGRATAKAIYGTDSLTVAEDAAEWARKNGRRKRVRIALCGLEGEHAMPDDWQMVRWSRNPGYASQAEGGKGRENAKREAIWFSPHCLNQVQLEIPMGDHHHA